MNKNMKNIQISLAVIAILLLAGMPAVAGDKEVDKTKVYYGDPDNFSTPAVITLLTVFENIPEYVDAKKKSEDDPEYYILLKKANEKFQKAVKKVATDEGYDLVGEVGTVKVKGKEVPDVTDKVVKALSE